MICLGMDSPYFSFLLACLQALFLQLLLNKTRISMSYILPGILFKFCLHNILLTYHSSRLGAFVLLDLYNLIRQHGNKITDTYAMKLRLLISGPYCPTWTIILSISYYTIMYSSDIWLPVKWWHSLVSDLDWYL